MKKYIDFHTHTTYSDGVDSPRTLVRNARFSGLDALAITDHDNLLGFYEAKQEAEKWGIQLIPGVEITTPVYHILGINIDPENPDFREFLSYSRDLQKCKASKRVKILQEQGIPITMDSVISAFPRSRIGKYNLVMTLMINPESSEYLIEEFGRLPTHNEIFEKYFGKKTLIGNVESQEVSAEEAIRQIHNAGGLAILAHPFKQVKRFSEIDELVDLGLDGLEIQPNYGEENKKFEEYADSHELIKTYGSDYHGIAFTRPLLSRRDNNFDFDLLEQGVLR